MLTNEYMTIALIFLNILMFLWMFVIGVYHYFLHQEHNLARELRNELEKAVYETLQAQKDARQAEGVAMLRCKINGCDHK